MIPVHSGEIFGPDPLKDTLRQAGMTTAEFERWPRGSPGVGARGVEDPSVLRYGVLIRRDSEKPIDPVTAPTLPGCFTRGATVDDALAMARDAIATDLEGDEDAPPDRGAIVATVEVDDPVAVPA